MTNIEQSATQKQSKRVPLVEMFGPTIQGEGAVIGQQTYFMRFGLCDYKCKMCDSMHAVDPTSVKENASYLTNVEIYDQFMKFRKENTTRWITYSGGNPCIHDLLELTTRLRQAGFYISVETQGTFCPKWLEQVNMISCSPKGPGMGEKLELPILDKFVNALQWHRGIYLKVVIFDERDLEVARMLYERYVLSEILSPAQFYLSQGNPYLPQGGTHTSSGESLKTANIRDYLCKQYVEMLPSILNDRYLCNVKFLPQLHVWLYGNKQGV